jgi:hypothetical protein
MPKYDTLIALAILAPLLGGLFAYLVSCRRGLRANLDHWALSNGYRLIQVDSICKHPFKSVRKKRYHVFHVHLIDTDGTRREGWVKVKLTWGISDEVDVIWDEGCPWDAH